MMIQGQHQYYTPALRGSKLLSFKKLLGFFDYEYDFFEVYEDHILQSTHVKKTHETPFFAASEFSQVPRSRFDFHRPVWALVYQGEFLEFNDNTRVDPFWEAFSSLPLGRLSQWFAKRDAFEWKLYPQDLKDSFFGYLESLQKLYLWMKQRPLTYLVIERAEHSMALLFHFERGKCVRVGTSEELEKLGQKALLGEVRSEDLKAVFPKRVVMMKLQLEDLKDTHPWEVISTQIIETIEKKDLLVDSRSHHSDPTGADSSL